MRPRVHRSRGFSLLEVLLAVAIVGGGIISMLLIRTNAVQMAGEAIRLRKTRLLAAEQAGHALAMGLSTTLQPRETGEEFEGFRVERVVEEVAFEELLPEELIELPAEEPGEPGAAPGSSGSSDGGDGGDGAGQIIRRLVVVVYPPGSEEDPTMAVTIVTYQIDEPDAGPAGGDDAESNFPEQQPPLVGRGAVGPPGSQNSGSGDGGNDGSEEKDPVGDPSGPGSNPTGGG
jgi:prepilin-type N-terminal cleavage/methylation domain-containing protein